MIELTEAELSHYATLCVETFDAITDFIDGSDASPGDVIFSMWINLTHMLAASGWTAEELVKEVLHHANSETAAGTA